MKLREANHVKAQLGRAESVQLKASKGFREVQDVKTVN
jgi:hypothetical protein